MTLSLLLLLLASVAIAQERYADPRQHVNQFAAQPSGVAPTVALGQTRVVGQVRYRRRMQLFPFPFPFLAHSLLSPLFFDHSSPTTLLRPLFSPFS